ncbi:MAG: ABC transporter permease subunit [Kiritimatiellae bacterium]|nr:ABC transporter permease subunit [Kiritimatiellia bacterium]
MTPLAKKRWQAFKRIRRAWWSLLALLGIFVFCLAADFVCPFKPGDVADVKTLEKYQKPVVEDVYDVRTARFSVTDEGELFDWEGPKDEAVIALRGTIVKALKTGAALPASQECQYDITVKDRQGYKRVFMAPLMAPKCTSVTLPPPPVSFPFRPVPEHPFGLDAAGRDVYSRVVHGMRIALLFGLALTLSGMFIGLVAGAVEGYFGGKTDILCQRLTEIWSAMPFLYVMIFIGSTLGRSFGVLFVCYAAFNWITVSYYMRSEFLRLRGRTFVDAARVEGLSSMRILFVHILPNALTPMVTLFPFLLMGAIGTLASLDFLGFGLPPMTPSCGELLAEAQKFRDAWWLVLFPSLALFTVMLLTVFVGEGLRDAFDPRSAK